MISQLISQKSVIVIVMVTVTVTVIIIVIVINRTVIGNYFDT